MRTSYTAKIIDNMKTRAENRCNSIDLLSNERLARLFRLANAQIPERLPMKIRRQTRMLVYVAAQGIGSQPA